MDAKTNKKCLYRRHWLLGWVVNSSAHVSAWCWVCAQNWASSAKSECFRDKATVWCLFRQKLMCFPLINKLNGADCFSLQICATHFPLKIWTYWCQYFQNVSKRMISCCFIEELRETSKREDEQSRWRLGLLSVCSCPGRCDGCLW